MYNNITFALLYWELDSGGPATRFFEPRRYPDFAFPQQLNPEIAPPNWRPGIDRLPVPRADELGGVQSHRRHAVVALGEGHDGGAVADLDSPS